MIYSTVPFPVSDLDGLDCRDDADHPHDLPTPRGQDVTNPGCAKFGVFLFSPLSCPVCDGPVLFPVLSLSGLPGLLGPGLVFGLVSETF